VSYLKCEVERNGKDELEEGETIIIQYQTEAGGKDDGLSMRSLVEVGKKCRPRWVVHLQKAGKGY